MWLSLSMIMLDRSCRCGSIPPTSIPYFSTSRKPGVVLRVPATVPRKPAARARSRTRRDLRRAPASVSMNIAPMSSATEDASSVSRSRWL